jgi:hypothetical protein
VKKEAGGTFLNKKMIASDQRVCLGGSTPPFRASPKPANIVFSPAPPSKNFGAKGKGNIRRILFYGKGINPRRGAAPSPTNPFLGRKGRTPKFFGKKGKGISVERHSVERISPPTGTGTPRLPPPYLEKIFLFKVFEGEREGKTFFKKFPPRHLPFSPSPPLAPVAVDKRGRIWYNAG